MGFQIQQSTTAYAIPFLLVSSTDHISPATGVTPTVTLSKNGGTFASPSGTVSEIGSGWYKIAGNATDSNTLGSLTLHATGTGADPSDTMFEVVIQVLTTATQSVNVTSINSVSTSSVSAINANQGTTQPLNFTGTAGSATVKSDTVNIAGTASVGVAGKVALDFTTPTFPLGAVPIVGMIENGTAQSVTGTTLVMRSAAAFADSELVGATLVITGGTTGVGQRRIITANVGSTDTLTVDTWTTTPTGTILYEIWPSAPGSATSLTPVNVVAFGGTAGTFTAGKPTVQDVAGSVTGSVGSVTGAVGSVTGNVGGNVTGSVGSVTGAVGSVTGNVGGNVTGSIGTVATNGITLASLDQSSGLKPIRAATAQAGASTSITLDASASSVDNFYNNTLVETTGGTGGGQSRFITAYAGATKIATVAAWVTNPSSSTTFVIHPFDSVPGATAPTSAANADAVWNRLTSAITTPSSVGAQIVANLDASVSTRLAPTTAGRTLDVSATGTAGIDWANVDGQSTAVNLSTTNIQQATQAPTSGDLTASMKLSVENSVLDANAASHNTAGTIGNKINSAGSSADPLLNPIGTYTGSQIGTLIQGSAQTSTILNVNITKINGVNITGAGVAGNPFQP